jgi:hypothetical protein
MKAFIDRARDYLTLGYFSDSEREDVGISLELYDALRAKFSITEEDVDNIENLLCLADLGRLVNKSPITKLSTPFLSDHVRRFIISVITKSVSVPGPNAAEWQGPDDRGPLAFKTLLRALAYHGRGATVLTLNYDCLVEYACYCMGLPFTYDVKHGQGVEILKLHGSANWLFCSNPGCASENRVKVYPIRHAVRRKGDRAGYLETDPKCPECRERLTPLVVPPTWSKDVDKDVLRQTWSRAV